MLHDPTKEVVRIVTATAWSAAGTGPLSIDWNRNHLDTTHVNITFVMFGYLHVVFMRFTLVTSTTNQTVVLTTFYCEICF